MVQPSRWTYGQIVFGVLAATAGAVAAVWFAHRCRSSRRRTKKAVRPKAVVVGEAKGIQAEFDAAVAWVAASGGKLTTNIQLALYGCYKQVNVGDCQGSKPWGMEAGMKWDAWSKKRGVGKKEAMTEYVAILTCAIPEWRSGGGAAASADDDDIFDDDATASQRGKEDGGVSMGPSVSTMRAIGDPADAAATDTSPIGLFNELVTEGNIEGVMEALKAVPFLLLQRDQDGMSPLHWAADRGFCELAELLLKEASKLPQKDGEADAVSTLLSARDDNGDTALHYAVNAENDGIAQLLVSWGASTALTNEDGETPASLAQELGWEKL
mmetsp:Transcript_22263/g.41005  ORF Transcript_22263/g.41005 Transcript_22263/m.41005 type:complete len:325 (+) Transcript_22263:119-1093(+)